MNEKDLRLEIFNTLLTTPHRDLDKVFKEGRAPTLLYTHEEHFATGVSDCSVCHPGNTHEPDTINKPTMTRCFTCHGLTSVAIAPGECSTCHPPGMPETPETHQVERWLPTAHGERAKTDRFECLTCHRERFCTSCHGLELPHPQGWEDVPHAEAFFELGSKNCAQCHPRAPEVRDDCDTCHHPEGPQRVGWRAAHAQAVTDRGAEDCFECHDPSTCVTCHLQGRETFAADRDRLAAAQAEG